MAGAYFDVDGTLVSTNLIQPTLFYLVNQATPVQTLQRLGRALVGAPRMAVAELVDRRTFNELLYSSYAGMSEDRLMMLADEVFDRVIRPAVYPSARDLVRRSLDAGHDVIFVSGTLDFILQRVADYFEATEYIANRLELKKGTATGKLLKPVVAGPEKARLIRAHAEPARAPEAWNEILTRGVRASFFLTLPLALWFWFNAAAVTRLLLERGAFSTRDAQTTAALAQLLMLAVVPAGILLVLTRGLHARQQQGDEDANNGNHN